MLLGNFNEVGGREIHQDDLRILQQELLKAIQLQYFGQGAFILQGCAVAGSPGSYNIGSGLVFINGLVMEFDAVIGISLFPQYMAQGPDLGMDFFPLEQGGSSPKRTLQKAHLNSSLPSNGEFIVMSASGGRNYNDILAANFVRLQGSQVIAGQKQFTSDVISNGLNVNAEINTIKANAWVTSPRIAAAAIHDYQIADAAVGTNHIADGSVTGTKLVGDSVSTSKIVNGAVDSSKLADGSVTASKIAGGNVTFAKLGSDVTSLFSGNGSSSDGSVDFSAIATYSTRTYGNKLFTLTNDTGRVRPYVRMQIQLARDSGPSDIVRLDIQRASSVGGPFTTISTRTYKLDSESWTNGIIDFVDTGASAGSNYYRLVATVTSGGVAYMSNNFSATIFGVSVFN